MNYFWCIIKSFVLTCKQYGIKEIPSLLHLLIDLLIISGIFLGSYFVIGSSYIIAKVKADKVFVLFLFLFIIIYACKSCIMSISCNFLSHMEHIPYYLLVYIFVSYCKINNKLYVVVNDRNLTFE